jgi:PAS domain S-box-containing protein
MSDSHQRTLRTILTGSAGWLALKNQNLAYEVVNPNFCQFVGRGPEEIVGKTDADLFPAAEADTGMNEGRTVLRNGIPRHIEQQFTGRDGTGWFAVYRAPILDDNGDPAGIIMTAHDITAFKEREAKVVDAEARQAAVEQEAAARVTQAEDRARQAEGQLQNLESGLKRETEKVSEERDAALEQASSAREALDAQAAQLEDALRQVAALKAAVEEARSLEQEVANLRSECDARTEQLQQAGHLAEQLSATLSGSIPTNS